MNPSYAVTRYPTPVFNTPEIQLCFGGKDGKTLPLDEQGFMREVETVLFPGTKVKLLEKMAQVYIWRVQTDEYNCTGPFYIDERFIQQRAVRPRPRQIPLLPVPTILGTLDRLEKTPYIWGGNWPSGIDFLPQLYPSKIDLNELDPPISDTWRLRGVDCSGLLYYATNGWTPRNTSALIHFGDPIEIENKDATTILKKLQGLDIIVWKGHVVCILDHRTTIESMPGVGVIKRNSLDRLTEIMLERKPVNLWGSTKDPHFVILRWHPHNRDSAVKKTVSL
jgi:hypothetical protein